MTFGARVPVMFFTFGSPRAKGSHKAFLLTDPDTGEYIIWTANRWSHVCIAYEKARGFIKVVLVSLLI